MKGRSQSGDER